MRGGCEGGLDLGGIAIVIVERDVVGDVLVEQRRAGFCRLRGVGDRGQRLDVEFDGFRRIARLRQRLGDDEGNGIANESHLVGRQRHTIGL